MDLKYHIGRVLDLLLWMRDCHRYRKIDYFQYKKLCSFHKMPDINPFQYNLGYGNNMAVNALTGHKMNCFRDYLEHGLWYSDTISVLDRIIKTKKVNNIYTYSNFRKEIIEKALSNLGLSNKVIAVGPYIIGAKNFYPREQLEIIKQKLGKTLLVFPMHSYPGVDNQYDQDAFINEIDKIRNNFDTILVCLAYKDVQRKAYKLFNKKGYLLVSNGCPGDPMFLSRQKDLIELSDITMSNGMGTHIGYSIALGKPHYFFYQRIDSKVAKPTAAELRELQVREDMAQKVKLLFGQFSDVISEEQVHFIKQLWGEF